MNSANYVDQQIKKLKDSGMHLQDAAWQAALLCTGWPYIFGDRGEYCTPDKRRAVYNNHPDQTGLVSQCQVLSNKSASCNGCKWYPSGLRVRSFDCRGFTYWILLQIYDWKLDGAGCTSQWNKESNWKAKGTVDDLPDDTLVCLFYRSKDNKNVMQHTGFYYKGETIECGAGVQYSKTLNKKWQYWAMPACIDAEPPAPDPDKKPTLRRGDEGSYVTLAQTELMQKGYDLGKWGADGKFGAQTEKAVKQFQKDNGLIADGVIGKKTWDALLNASPVLYTVSIPHLSKSKADELVNEYPGASAIDERWN